MLDSLNVYTYGPGHSKPDHSKSYPKNVRDSNVSGIGMSSIRIPAVLVILAKIIDNCNLSFIKGIVAQDQDSGFR